MLREHEKEILYLRRMLDLGLSAGSFTVAYYLQAQISLFNKEMHSFGELAVLLIPLAAIWWLVFYKHNIYQSMRQISLLGQLYAIAKSFMLGMLIFLGVVIALKLPLPSRTFLGLFSILNIGALVTEKWAVAIFAQWVRKRGFNTRNALIVGMQKEAEHLISAIQNHPEWGICIMGVVTVEPQRWTWEVSTGSNALQFKGVPILGSLKEFREILENNIIDFTYFAVAPTHLKRIQAPIMFSLERGINTRVTLGYFHRLPFINFGLKQLEGLPMLSLHTTQVEKGGHLFKCSFDRLASAIGLVLLSPIFIVAAILIKLDSKGPVFFKQERVGQNGRLFKMVKFRSMSANAEADKEKLQSQNEMSGPVFKISNDPRITRVGRFLRKASLDEFPQLINVLVGDMSLVGPRPPLPDEVAQYDNWQRRRLSVKPGITCTWQVSGRNNIDFEQWMKMDLDYIDKWSIAQDAKLLLKTMPAVIFQKGAK